MAKLTVAEPASTSMPTPKTVGRVALPAAVVKIAWVVLARLYSARRVKCSAGIFVSILIATAHIAVVASIAAYTTIAAPIDNVCLFVRRDKLHAMAPVLISNPAVNTVVLVAKPVDKGRSANRVSAHRIALVT